MKKYLLTIILFFTSITILIENTIRQIFKVNPKCPECGNTLDIYYSIPHYYKDLFSNKIVSKYMYVYTCKHCGGSVTFYR